MFLPVNIAWLSAGSKKGPVMSGANAGHHVVRDDKERRALGLPARKPKAAGKRIQRQLENLPRTRWFHAERRSASPPSGGSRRSERSLLELVTATF
jgi:hypothetical protein